MPFSSTSEYPTKIVQKQVGTTDTEFFGAGNRPKVSHIVLTNTSGAAVVVEINDGDGNSLVKNVPLANNDRFVLNRGFEPTVTGLVMKTDTNTCEATVFAFGATTSGALWKN